MKTVKISGFTRGGECGPSTLHEVDDLRLSRGRTEEKDRRHKRDGENWSRKPHNRIPVLESESQGRQVQIRVGRIGMVVNVIEVSLRGARRNVLVREIGENVPVVAARIRQLVKAD